MNAEPETAPIACHLAALPDRVRYQVLSDRLRAAITGRTNMSDGYSYSLQGELLSLAELGEWIGLERQCCPFLNFELTASGRENLWRLTLTGPDGVKPILEREFPA